MKRASRIITDHSGRTSHAAIVGRELGIPAVVGTGNATDVLENGRTVNPDSVVQVKQRVAKAEAKGES